MINNDTAFSFISYAQPLDETKKEVPLNIVYEPISIGKLRLFIEMEKSIEAMYNLGKLYNSTSLLILAIYRQIYMHIYIYKQKLERFNF